MSAHLLDWMELLLRWLHIIVGIAWIGASFYFNWLEGRLDRGEGKPKGIAGDLWSVHGGGFYHVSKYEVAPEQLPSVLHWFKWEAYTTWISGFALLLIVYYLNPTLRILGENPYELSVLQASVTGLGSLLASWGLYHALCRSSLIEKPLIFIVIGLALLTALSFGLTQVFDARAAYIYIGAIIGTIMAANVFFVIIPAQRQMVGAMMRGEVPDPAPGKDALRRSLHNNYLTLPVLFIMISQHFPMSYGHPHNWAILMLLAVGSALVRHAFNLRNRGQEAAWVLPVSILILFVLILWTRPIQPPEPVSVDTTPVAYSEVAPIIEKHCVSCHSAQPTDRIFTFAPLGLVLDTPEQVQASANKVYARTVRTHTMPLANASGMTDEERELLGRWITGGALLEDD